MTELSESKKTKHHPALLQIRGTGYFSRIGPGILTGAVMMAALPVLWLFAPN
jgi:hypothetical protein